MMPQPRLTAATGTLTQPMTSVTGKLVRGTMRPIPLSMGSHHRSIRFRRPRTRSPSPIGHATCRGPAKDDAPYHPN